MIRLTVTTTLASRRTEGGNIWFPFEMDEPDLQSVHRRLLADGCLYGIRVTTEKGENDERIVTARVPHILGRDAIATICPCHFTYATPERAQA